MGAWNRCQALPGAWGMFENGDYKANVLVVDIDSLDIGVSQSKVQIVSRGDTVDNSKNSDRKMIGKNCNDWSRPWQPKKC